MRPCSLWAEFMATHVDNTIFACVSCLLAARRESDPADHVVEILGNASAYIELNEWMLEAF